MQGRYVDTECSQTPHLVGEGRGEGGHGAGGEAGHGGGGGDCRGQEARADVAVLRTNQR